MKALTAQESWEQKAKRLRLMAELETNLAVKVLLEIEARQCELEAGKITTANTPTKDTP